MKEWIGIIAGGGQFPRIIAQEARKQGYCVAICGFHGNTDASLADYADAFQIIALGQLNKLITFFREHTAVKLCMAGSIAKPKTFDIKPDFRAIRLYFSLSSKGDDALLRVIIGELEKEGFSMMQAADFAPDLYTPIGILSKKQPNEDMWKDIAYGWPVAENIGRFDIGQTIVVKNGIIIAVECIEGTDATLRRAAEIGGSDCVVLKIAKPGQEERVDLPSVGLQTVEFLVEHKFSCLAIVGEKSLFFDRAEALKCADKHGLCIVALGSSDIEAMHTKYYTKPL